MKRRIPEITDAELDERARQILQESGERARRVLDRKGPDWRACRRCLKGQAYRRLDEAGEWEFHCMACGEYWPDYQ